MEDKKMLEQKHIISTEIILQALNRADEQQDGEEFIDGLMNELNEIEHEEDYDVRRIKWK